MINFSRNLKKIKAKIGNQIQLVAVSKKQPISSIMALYEEGQRDFGESYIQELIQKYQKLPQDIRWHMIGKIQVNKLKYIAPFIYMIHSIEKFTHLQILEREAAKHSRTIRSLLQIKISREPSKSGMSIEQAKDIIHSFRSINMLHIQLLGFMGIATFTRNKQIVNKEFSLLHDFFMQFKKDYPNFKILSMGMSLDYMLAISCGSNMVRIGSNLFGRRIE